jgi:hypothetical protein
MGEVARSVTPLSRGEAAAGIVSAYRAHTGHDPNRQLAELLLAQVWLETARGQSVVCHNWGNLSGSYQGSYWRPPWFEVTDASSARNKHLNAEMLAGRAPRSFRAYRDHKTGAHDYLRLLLTERYRPIIATASAGDPRAFAIAVQSTGYCPDCVPSKTEPTFRALQSEFRAAGVFSHLAQSSSSGDDANLAPLIILAAGAYLFYATLGKRWLS